METDELRTVRVYTKKYTSKDKQGNTVEKESKQKQVSLKKEDPFEDNDLVKVLAQSEYEALIDNQFSRCNQPRCDDAADNPSSKKHT